MLLNFLISDNRMLTFFKKSDSLVDFLKKILDIPLGLSLRYKLNMPTSGFTTIKPEMCENSQNTPYLMRNCSITIINSVTVMSERTEIFLITEFYEKLWLHFWG